MILESEPDIVVVAEAADGAEAVEIVRTTEIDLAVVDVAMPRMTGLQAVREMVRRRRDLKILMLSMHDNEQYFFESLKAGASGYVLKSAADQDLINACRAAMRGEPFLYPGVTSTLVRTYLERLRRGDRLPRTDLTARGDRGGQTDRGGAVLQGDRRDCSTISLKTVERHRSNILANLGLRDRTQLTRYAIRAGLIEP